VTYAESLLEAVKTEFCERFGSNLKYSTSFTLFDKQFTELHEKVVSLSFQFIFHFLYWQLEIIKQKCPQIQ
jgi:hypothetical protein